MFTEVFLATTDPNLTFSQVFRSQLFVQIAASIVFHIIIYVAFLNLVSAIFSGKPLAFVINQRLVAALLVIMVGGYMARACYVKEIYRAYRGNDAQAREHVDKVFTTWIFIG